MDLTGEIFAVAVLVLSITNESLGKSSLFRTTIGVEAFQGE